MCLVVVVQPLSRYFGHGPMWPDAGGKCDSRWWTDLTFVSNFFDKEDGCEAGIGWFVSTAVQLTVVAPLALFPLGSIPVISHIVVFAAIVVCFIATSYFAMGIHVGNVFPVPKNETYVLRNIA